MVILRTSRADKGENKLLTKLSGLLIDRIQEVPQIDLRVALDAADRGCSTSRRTTVPNRSLRCGCSLPRRHLTSQGRRSMINQRRGAPNATGPQQVGGWLRQQPRSHGLVKKIKEGVGYPVPYAQVLQPHTATGVPPTWPARPFYSKLSPFISRSGSGGSLVRHTIHYYLSFPVIRYSCKYVSPRLVSPSMCLVLTSPMP